MHADAKVPAAYTGRLFSAAGALPPAAPPPAPRWSPRGHVLTVRDGGHYRVLRRYGDVCAN
jgi:hypothetical protein